LNNEARVFHPRFVVVKDGEQGAGKRKQEKGNGKAGKRNQVKGNRIYVS